MPTDPRDRGKPETVSQGVSGGERYSYSAERTPYDNESYLVAAAAAEILAGKTPDVARYDRVAQSLETGKTGQQIVDRAAKYAESSLAKAAKAALDGPYPREAVVMLAKKVEYDKVHASLLLEQEARLKRIKELCTSPWIQRLAVASIMLLIALFEMPDGYYSILRVVITVIASIAAFRLYTIEIKHGCAMAVGVAITYNPFSRIEMESETWCVVNVMTIAMLAYITYRAMQTSLSHDRSKGSKGQHDSIRARKSTINDTPEPHQVEIKSTGPIIAVNERAVAQAKESRAEHTTPPEQPKPESNEDQEYLAALSRKDMAEVKRLVLEAAHKAGYTVGPVWPRPATSGSVCFKPDQTMLTVGQKLKKHGYWFLKETPIAQVSASFNSEMSGKVVDSFFLRMDRRVVWSSKHESKKVAIIKALKQGVDGVVFAIERKGHYTWQYYVFYPVQAQRADAVLLNDKGNVILPSDRFRKGTTGDATITKEHAKPIESADSPGKPNDGIRTDFLTLEASRLPTKSQSKPLSKPVRARQPSPRPGTDRYTPEEWEALQTIPWLDLPLELKIKTVQCCDDPFTNNSDLRTPIVRIGPNDDPIIARGPPGRPKKRIGNRLKLTPEQLADIIRNHGLYLRKNPKGARANLRDADLPGVDLSNVDLRGAEMAWANLSCANLSGADFRGANMAGVNLWGAKMDGADLARADLFMVALSDVQLAESNLLAIQQAKAKLLKDSFMLPEQPKPELKSDQQYLAAICAGDMEKVMAALTLGAKDAGYNVGPVWHGTQSPGFYEFAPDKTKPATGFQRHGHGFWFSDDPAIAQEFARIDPEMPIGNITSVYLCLRHMVRWEREHEPEESAIARAIKDGADGVIFDNLRNGTSERHTEYLVFNLVKAAYADHTIKYKDIWTVELPSERFKQTQPGIRFSISAT